MESVLAVISSLGWIGTLLFIGVYHRTARWWKNPYGRALFLTSFSLLLFFASAVLFNVFGEDYPGRLALRVISLSLNTGIIWYLLITIVRGGVNARANRREEKERVHHES